MSVCTLSKKTPPDKNAVRCNLLYSVMSEGFADFIGELVAEARSTRWLWNMVTSMNRNYGSS